jgi:REP element-mobilizing transposase RayT
MKQQELDTHLEMLILTCMDESRRRLGFALCGYVLMPDHWHALLWPSYPLTISRVVQDIKCVSARRINRLQAAEGLFGNISFGTGL